MAKFTESQAMALSVLRELGGWVCNSHVRRYGLWPVSLHVLAREGRVLYRETMDNSGQYFQEWKAKPEDA